MSGAMPLAFMLAGGTGGHVYPALAVALELRERGFTLRWIGTSRGLESRVVSAAEIPLHELPMRGLRGKGLLQKCWGAALLMLSTVLSLWIMLRYRPALVVGMGGYASFPAAIAAWVTRRPLMLQEQNAVPGSANKALATFSSAIATGFPAVLSDFAVTRYLGNPVRADLVDVAQNSPWQRRNEGPLRVSVMGGSLGARPLNEALPGIAAVLQDRCVWRHQCGPQHEETTREAYTAAGVRDCQVEAYVEDMAAMYAWSDLVICRAGALTVAELAVTGRPAILIPLPYAIDDHQTANAAFLADAGAAVLLPQDDMAARLHSEILSLLDDVALLPAMSAAALRRGKPAATQDIADYAQATAQ
ncbi:MAG: undecaprenyldiphospho-muramoylpentapeptide beta-N-acetylglucosaminyltransferase [Congregibacter sp.]